MDLRRVIVIAASLLPAAAAPASAQSPWPQPAQQQTQAPWPQQPAQPAQAPWPQQPQAGQTQAAQPPGQDPWSRPPQQQAGEPPCFKEFTVLRTDAQKKAGAIQAASARDPKPTAKEACGLFNSFAAAESKMVKYAVSHADECRIPPQVIDAMKQAHGKTNGIRANVCRVAAAPPPRPAGPSLSDALGAPVPNSSNIKSGRGTFDTLTGSPLGR